MRATVNRRVVRNLLAVLAGVALLGPGAALLVGQEGGQAAGARSPDVSCEMTFTMKGWSAFVSKSEGKGTLSCDNGQRADVVLSITGGGLTFGRTVVEEGKGVFSDVTDISELFGSYAQAEASAGAVESVSAQALTKGSVSLAITTKGRGWSLGVSGAKFSIERAGAK